MRPQNLGEGHPQTSLTRRGSSTPHIVQSLGEGLPQHGADPPPIEIASTLSIPNSANQVIQNADGKYNKENFDPGENSQNITFSSPQAGAQKEENKMFDACPRRVSLNSMNVMITKADNCQTQLCTRQSA